jgi:hypothetical protein
VTVLEPISDDDTVMTLDEFTRCVLSGAFIEYDGMGNYAVSDKEMTDVVVNLQDIRDFKKIPSKFTHVVWFNK